MKSQIAMVLLNEYVDHIKVLDAAYAGRFRTARNITVTSGLHIPDCRL